MPAKCDGCKAHVSTHQKHERDGRNQTATTAEAAAITQLKLRVAVDDKYVCSSGEKRQNDFHQAQLK